MTRPSEEYWCQCVARQCNTRIDKETGAVGVRLSSRDFKRHEKSEKDRIRSQDLLEAQERAIKNQADAIANALDRLSINNNFEHEHDVLFREAKFRADLKWKLIDRLSEAQEHVLSLERDIKTIGVAPVDHPPVDEIKVSLSGCLKIRKSTGNARKTLSSATSGSLRKEQSIKCLCEQLNVDLDRLQLLLNASEASWKTALAERERLDRLRSGVIVFKSDKHFEGIFKGTSTIIQLSSLMVTVCSVMLGFSRRGCLWLFQMCSHIIETTLLEYLPNSIIPNHLQRIIRSFPRDIRASTKNFCIDGKAAIFAVCPKCHATYKPEGPEDMPYYKPRCNSYTFNNLCGEILVRPTTIRRKKVYLPIIPYVVYDLPDWIANLMSRSGYEKMMDDAWEWTTKQENDHYHDIFQGSVIRNFMGSDKKTHFKETGDETTGRYLFSMGFDFFNPLRNLANGKKVSIGMIAIICLNLPVHLRYKPENIFIAAIIPGPNEPKLDGINPYIRPIIDVFLQLWKGIQLTRTSIYIQGRLIVCALVATICDLPAARKIGGFSSCNHEYFCSLCWCTNTQHSYNNFNYHSWKRRTLDDCRQRATDFCNAQTQKQQQSLFDKSGLRYSELWRLPYFDPTKHLVVDPMHNLFLGLIKEHFQNILGYAPKGVKDKRKNTDLFGDTVTVTVSPSEDNPLPEDPKQRASIRKLILHLQEPLEIEPLKDEDRATIIKRWSKVHKSALIFVGRCVRCIPDSLTMEGKDSALAFQRPLSKIDLAEMLFKWRVLQEEHIDSSSMNSIKPGTVFTRDEITEIWSDIDSVIKPSWATSVPPNITSFGPKLKSDQWRSVGTLILPLSLVRLWGTEEQSQERKDLLHLTMLLCSAICIATSRTVSSKQADEYLNHMTQYRQELQRLFPKYKCHPNHHMAMHIGEFITNYGPVHGWWTFPFERVIGSLQRIRTNYKKGEYEKTISHSWHRSSNLKAIFLKSTTPQAILNCVKMFNTLVKPQNSNNLANYSALDPIIDEQDEEELHKDIHDLERVRTILSPEEYNAILSKLGRGTRASSMNLAFTKNRLTVNDITYNVNSMHEGNSCILAQNSNTPYSIINILELENLGSHNGTWFLVKRHKPAHIKMDPYARYPHIRAKIWGVGLEDDIEAIPLSQVDTHFAKCEIDWEGKRVIVVFSLSKINVV